MPPSRTNSQAKRFISIVRCWVPVCTTRPYLRAADQRAAFADVQRQRLLAVDILARLTSQHAGQHMVMVAGGDDHRVQIPLLDHLAIVLVDLPIGLMLCRDRGRLARVGIADRRDASRRGTFRTS
jgi:hypothetical protein